MSRVAKSPINILENVDFSINENIVNVKGSKGVLEFNIPQSISLEIKENIIHVKYDETDQQSVALAGTTRSLINNMIIGVTKGFEKKLELIGVGYRANVQGKKITLTQGFSHPVEYQLPENVEAKSEGQTEFNLTSADKQLLGQVCAEIRAFRPPEPYKGKGVFIDNETIIRKERKKAATA